MCFSSVQSNSVIYSHCCCLKRSYLNYVVVLLNIKVPGILEGDYFSTSALGSLFSLFSVQRKINMQEMAIVIKSVNIP